jgi:hypothetical protein
MISESGLKLYLSVSRASRSIMMGFPLCRFALHSMVGGVVNVSPNILIFGIVATDFLTEVSECLKCE